MEHEGERGRPHMEHEGARRRPLPRPALPPFPEPTEFEVPPELVTGQKVVDDLNDCVANMYTSVAVLRQQVYSSGAMEAHDPKSLGKSNQGAWDDIKTLLNTAKVWRLQVEAEGAKPFEEPAHLSSPIPKP